MSVVVVYVGVASGTGSSEKKKGRYINIVMKTRSSAVAERLRGYVRTILRAYYYF